MVIGNISINSLSLTAATTALAPLFLFIIAMAIYAIFVYNFYRFVAKRDIFKLHLHKHSESFKGFLEDVFHVVLYILEYLIIFPVFTFFWFIILTIIIMFLSQQDIANVLLVAMALVGAVRITAYYSEGLSKDLAKMLPFALLGVFLLDISNFSFQDSFAMLTQLPGMWQTILYYFLFVVALEFVLRIIYLIVHPFLPKKREG